MDGLPKIVRRSPEVIEEEPGMKAWCSCGLSSKQPYCDGSHRGTGMSPVRIEVEEKKKVAWCMCKHTAGQAVCDGSHRNLPE